jgi:hypothetical protein
MTITVDHGDAVAGFNTLTTGHGAGRLANEAQAVSGYRVHSVGYP